MCVDKPSHRAISHDTFRHPNLVNEKTAYEWLLEDRAAVRQQGFFKEIERTINKAKRCGLPLEHVNYSRNWRSDDAAAEVLARWTVRKLERATATANRASARSRL